MLTGQIDVNCESKISQERRIQLNQLGLQAYKNSTHSFSDDIVSNLELENYALMEVFDSLEDLGTWLDFYVHIDRAFRLLIESSVGERVSILQTYQDLSSLFRVIEKRAEYIIKKNRELKQIIDDLEVLEEDCFKHKDGGVSC